MLCAVPALTAYLAGTSHAQDRYPLSTTESTQQVSAQDEFGFRSLPQIRSLPPIRTLPKIQNAPPEEFKNHPTADAREELSRSFEQAYENLTGPEDVRSLPSFPVTNSNLGAPPARVAGNVIAGNVESDNNEFLPGGLDPSTNRFEAVESKTELSYYPSLEVEDPAEVDTDPAVWWKPFVVKPLLSQPTQKSVDTNTLVYDTLRQSPRIRALSQNPLVREVQVIEADADFDPTSYVRSQFQDRVDPVGSDLSITADGSPFLQDHIWTGEFGIRKKARTGASYELGQTLGFKNSNSAFFSPQDQGTAQLALNVTQPLLRGRGRYYNESQILIAQAAGSAAWETFVGELQDEIQQTVESYWRLYYDRSVYMQKRRNVERGEETLRKLEGRAELDSLPSQIARARSAVKSRKTDLANALRDIRDSETELRRLTADRNWQANQTVELLPAEIPTTVPVDASLEQVVYTALEHRPEIKETMKRAKIAGIQKDISMNELLPELSFLIGTYVSALRGDSNLGGAIQDQFGSVTPGYSVGFEFEMPIRNRAARSRVIQRNLQMAKIKSEVDESVQNVIAESQIALRRVTSAQETLAAALQAIKAARTDLEQNLRRWESFALIEGDLADGQSPTTILDQLLDSQERLSATELVYAQAELELKISEVALQRSMGTLLIQQDVSFDKAYHCDIPELEIGKGGQHGVPYHGIPVGGSSPTFPKGHPSPHLNPKLSRSYSTYEPGQESFLEMSTPSHSLDTNHQFQAGIASEVDVSEEDGQAFGQFPVGGKQFKPPAKAIGYPLNSDQ